MFLAKEEATWAVKQDALLNAEEQRRAWYVHRKFRHSLDARYRPYLLYTLSPLSLASFPLFLSLPCLTLGSGARRKSSLRNGQSC